MKKSVVVFAVVGGVVVPAFFLLLGWAARAQGPADAAAMAQVHAVQLPLWPMSKLFVDDPSGRHWLYLPLAAVLSNALIYAAIGLVAAWGRTRRAGFALPAVAAIVLLVAAQQGFGTSGAGLAIATSVALVGLALHHFVRR